MNEKALRQLAQHWFNRANAYRARSSTDKKSMTNKHMKQIAETYSECANQLLEKLKQ